MTDLSTGPLHEVTCVSGEAFAVSSSNGDILPGGDQGYFVRDTRFLSALVLLVDGRPPRALHGDVVGPGAATFHSVVALEQARGVDPTLLVVRRRVVDEGLHEDVVFHNHGREPANLAVAFEVATDFAYVFDVRHGRAGAVRPRAPGDTLVFVRPDAPDRVELLGTPAPTLDDAGMQWAVEVQPGGQARICVDVVATDVFGPAVPRRRCEAFDDRGAASEPDGIDPGPVPAVQPEVDSADMRVQRLVRRSVTDLASLAVPDPLEPADRFHAAGSPWFLTLFGRDSLWAAFMALPVDPAMAAGTLRTLARRQGRRHDPTTGEAPGKILHEVRRGSLTHLADLPDRYYGTIDATPLFVVVASEAWRWGLPDSEVAALMPNVEAALAWMRDDGDVDGDGFLEYRHPEGRGLANQGWKDSHDGVQHADGRLAAPPIALSEVQAYAWDAAVRGAELLDHFGLGGADGWRTWADDLRRRFRAAFWVEDEDGPYPAIALDGEKRPVDGPASNMGHLLLSDFLDPDEQDAVADRLAGSALSSGWGLRTMAATAAGFNPVGYHTGSVWPHDTAIAVWGLARTGHHDAASHLLEGLLAVAPHYGYTLPELLAGVERTAGSYAVPHPVACRPQAWAAGAGLLLARALLGLDPHVPQGRLTLHPLWPSPVGWLRMHDLPLAGGRLHVAVGPSGVTVDPTDLELAISVVLP